MIICDDSYIAIVTIITLIRISPMLTRGLFIYLHNTIVPSYAFTIKHGSKIQVCHLQNGHQSEGLRRFTPTMYMYYHHFPSNIIDCCGDFLASVLWIVQITTDSHPIVSTLMLYMYSRLQAYTDHLVPLGTHVN